MTVNASKSKLILSLRGGVAKRWLQQKRHWTHTGHIISLGTPAMPINIPHVRSATYLGVELSFDSYETRSCKLRLKMAGAIRQRLLKLLHTPGLGLRTRLTLYTACVRSSMQYGLHAVGLTAHTSRMLEQKDARYLRAITRCPSHLTHESTAELRRRVKVSSPLQALCRMLDKRVVRCASGDSRAEFALLRERLRLIDNGSAVCDGLTGALIAADACNPVACNICGQYFSNMRLMKSHRTRQHGKTPRPSMPDSLQYASHTVDGMPQCRHCLQMFTRVEGLKKHLRGSCRILHQASTTAVATVSSGEVPPERETLLGCSHRTSPAAVAPVPLLQQTAFRSQVSQNWKHALADPSLARELRNYCVICAQWVSHSGGIKQHIRLMRESEWTLKSEAAARCSSLGLVVESPCHYCTRPVKDPRAHLSHCMPVFQASLAALLVTCAQEHGASGQGNGRLGAPAGDGSLGSSGDGAGAGDSGTGLGSKGVCTVARGVGRSEVQVAEARFQGTVRWGRQRLLPWLVARPQRSVVVRLNASGGGGEGASSQYGEDAHATRVGDAPAEAGYNLDVLRRHGGDGHSVAHPAESRGLAEAIHGEEGHEQPAGGSGDCGLSGAPGSHQRASAGPGTHDSDAYGRVAGRGLASNQSLLDLSTVVPREPEGRDLIPGPSLLHGGPGCPAADHQQHRWTGGGPEVQGDPTPDREDLERGSPLRAGAVSTRSTGSAGSSGPMSPEWMRLFCRRRPASSPGSRTAVPAGEGTRDLVHRRLLFGLETSDATVAEMAAAEAQVGRRSTGPAAVDPLRRAVSLSMSASPALPQGRLNNPHSICYLNAASQAFAWVGRLTVDEDYCYGSARAAMRPVLDSGRPYLPQCLAWRAHLREWRSIAQQQDACQFMEYLLSSAKPRAYLGTWQARLTLPFQVVDGGSLDAPILLDLPGTSDLTLQELLQHWHEQHTIHAVEKHSGVILLQLKRYAHVCGNPVKDARAVRWLPGERVAVPCFCEAQGIRVRFDYFRIAYVLCHVGPHTEAGHYQAILCVPTPHPARAGTFEWHNAVLNDNSKPRRAGARDRQLLECNCYLLSLIWDPGQ